MYSITQQTYSVKTISEVSMHHFIILIYISIVLSMFDIYILCIDKTNNLNNIDEYVF